MIRYGLIALALAAAAYVAHRHRLDAAFGHFLFDELALPQQLVTLACVLGVAGLVLMFPRR